MKKVIVEYDNGIISTYDIVNFRSYKKGKKEVLFNHVDDLVNHFSVKSYKFVEPTKKRSKEDSISSTYIPKNKKENIPMPIEIAEEIVTFAKGDGAGFTKEVVDRWNKYLNFNLHSKFERYGFTGSSRLNTIFKI
jgi:hypothetical protein